MALSKVTIQREEISHSQISNLFWVNTVVGLTLSLLFVALAPLISGFYGEPQVQNVVLCLAPVPLLQSIVVQPRAILARRMHFGKLGLVEITSQFGSIALAATLALKGAGYWALVSLKLGQIAFRNVGMWFASNWVPSWPKRGQGLRSMLKFGGNLTGGAILGSVVKRLDRILIGNVCGAAALGLYEKAYRYSRLPMSKVSDPFSTVAMRGLSALQNEPESFRKYLTTALTYVALIAMPIALYGLVYAPELIVFLLGEEWGGTVPIFRAFALVMITIPLVKFAGLVLIAQAETGRLLRWRLVRDSVLICAIVFGLQWGVNGVAICYSVATFVFFVVSLNYVLRDTPVSMRHFWISALPPLVMSIVAVTAGFCVKILLPDFSNFSILALSVPAFFGTYCLCWIALESSRQELWEFLRHLSSLLKRRGKVKQD